MSGKKVIIIKIGGRLLEVRSARRALLKDIIACSKKYRVAVVHGGGDEISRALESMSIPARFVQGQRYTDLKTLRVVVDVLRGVNTRLTGEIQALGSRSVGISGLDAGIVQAGRLPGPDRGLVGEVRKVRSGFLQLLWKNGLLPVIAPIGMNGKGDIYNINADLFASGLAMGLKADRLVLLTDVPGVLRDKRDRSSTIRCIRTGDFSSMVRSGSVSSGMIPKIASACRAVRRGVREVVIAGGSKGVVQRVLRGSGTSYTVIKK